MAKRQLGTSLGLVRLLLLLGVLSLSGGNALAGELTRTNADSGLQEINDFLDLVIQSKDIDVYGDAPENPEITQYSAGYNTPMETLHSKAEEYWYADDYANLKSAAEALRSFALEKGDTSHQLIADAYLAYATGGLDDYTNAAEQLGDTLERAALLDDKSAQITATILLATLEPYEARFLHAKAEIVATASLLDEARERERLKPAISCSLGYLAIELGEVDDAINQYSQCISEAKSASVRIDLGTIIYNTAMVLSEKAMTEASNTVFVRLIDWYEDTGQPGNKLYAYYGLAYNYYDLKDYSKSLEYVKAGLAISDEIDDFTVFLYQVGAIDAARTGDLAMAQQFRKISRDYFADRPEYAGTTWATRNTLVDAEIAFSERQFKNAYHTLEHYYKAREDILDKQHQSDIKDWRSEIEHAYQDVVAEQRLKLEQQTIVEKLQGGFIVFGVCLFGILLFGFLRLRHTTFRLMESEARFERAISNSRSGIWEIDLEANTRYYSPSIEELFGYQPQELVSQDDWLEIVFPPASMEELNRRTSVHQGAENYFDFDVVAIRKDQQEIWVNIEGSIQRDDKNVARTISGVTSDITNRKAAEHILSEAKRESDRLSRAKSEFIASMSHELRTPLNSVIGFSEVLRMDETHPLEDRQKECLGYIEKAGKHLLNIVNGIINISRIELGEIEFDAEQLDLSEVVKDCCSMVQPMAGECDVEIVNDVAPATQISVQADRQWTSQIVLNLLSNAIKYNLPGGKVTVQLEGGKTGTCRLSVIDTGIGIDDGQQMHLFELFNRLGVEKVSTASGSGIGLAVAKRMAKGMGGNIGFESQKGTGSRFWLELPVSKTASSEVTQGEISAA